LDFAGNGGVETTGEELRGQDDVDHGTQFDLHLKANSDFDEWRWGFGGVGGGELATAHN